MSYRHLSKLIIVVCFVVITFTCIATNSSVQAQNWVPPNDSQPLSAQPALQQQLNLIEIATNPIFTRIWQIVQNLFAQPQGSGELANKYLRDFFTNIAKAYGLPPPQFDSPNNNNDDKSQLVNNNNNTSASSSSTQSAILTPEEIKRQERALMPDKPVAPTPGL